jgi:hypothetical protein
MLDTNIHCIDLFFGQVSVDVTIQAHVPYHGPGVDSILNHFPCPTAVGWATHQHEVGWTPNTLSGILDGHRVAVLAAVEVNAISIVTPGAKRVRYEAGAGTTVTDELSLELVHESEESPVGFKESCRWPVADDVLGPHQDFGFKLRQE